MKGYIFYIQYTNPAYYPPLENSAKIFSEQEYQVFFLGTQSVSANDLIAKSRKNVTVRLLPYCPPGFFQKIHFLYFCFTAFWQAVFLRPRWIYFSDFMSTPAGVLLSLFMRKRIIYHEHDSPPAQTGLFVKPVFLTRSILARRAELCILPNNERMDIFIKTTGRTKQTLCVWNCPQRAEANLPQSSTSSQPLILYYHGSITPERLPLAVIEALVRMAGRAHLWIAGYETIGSRGYTEKIKAYVERYTPNGCVKTLGAFECRRDLILKMRNAHVGLSLMPKDATDINMMHMTGASNKPFDYMAGGLALVVSNISEWENMYVKPGYGLSCDPDSVDSIVQCLQWFLDHPKEIREMGEKGRQRILSEWNYEQQFKSVFKIVDCDS